MKCMAIPIEHEHDEDQPSDFSRLFCCQFSKKSNCCV